jgi:hypothetical protein
LIWSFIVCFFPVIDSGAGETSAQFAPGHEHPFVLESRSAVALRRDAKSRDRPYPAAQSDFAADREMDTTDAPWLLRCGTSPELPSQTTAPKVRADWRPLFQSTQLHEIGFLPPLHGLKNARMASVSFFGKARDSFV